MKINEIKIFEYKYNVSDAEKFTKKINDFIKKMKKEEIKNIKIEIRSTANSILYNLYW